MLKLHLQSFQTHFFLFLSTQYTNLNANVEGSQISLQNTIICMTSLTTQNQTNIRNLGKNTSRINYPARQPSTPSLATVSNSTCSNSSASISEPMNSDEWLIKGLHVNKNNNILNNLLHSHGIQTTIQKEYNVGTLDPLF